MIADEMMAAKTFPAAYFTRRDSSDDRLFYRTPRREAYFSDEAVSLLKQWFLKVLPPAGTYLDLMSGWRSHLPEELSPARVVGLGLNAEEMAENPQLDAFVVHDLNAVPSLPFESQEFDAVVCTASVQYLIKPVEVFREVNRVLRPGGVFVTSFSKSCFPQKAIAIWLVTTPLQRQALVKSYFEASGNWSFITTEESPQRSRSEPLQAVWASTSLKTSLP